ncbi:MAG: type I methionyl aminopeptidase [Campylobacteraceae bacterium]|jgi:methionyl aminopeptidase|nr:type I methionyl aminopeptidase [Campylobacteraceae bacterium]
MSISLRRPEEIKKIAAASRAVAKTLDYLTEQIRPDITTKELNNLAEEYIKSLGGRAAFKGLYGFPDGVCISVNEVVIHGIPNSYKLKEGDIVSLDVGVEIDGWYGDAAKTVGVGKIDKRDEDLISCSYGALMHAVDIIRDGMRFKELSYEIEKYIIKRGFVPLRGYCGHGIGRRPHEEPEILNYLEGGNPNQGPRIKEGMVFCVEPMICVKEGTPKVLDDKWSVVSVDGMRTSHYEHTIAIVDKKAKILSIDSEF